MKVVAPLLLCLASLAACSSDEGFVGEYEVTDVRIIADSIEIGEQVRTEVFFTTEVEVDAAPDGLDVIVKLPRSLQYDEGSSRIYDGSDDETDPREPDAVVECPNGTTFLAYNLGDSELRDRAISGLDTFGLRFEVIGVAEDASAQIQASAAETEPFSCLSNFDSEEEESVEILG